MKSTLGSLDPPLLFNVCDPDEQLLNGPLERELFLFMNDPPAGTDIPDEEAPLAGLVLLGELQEVEALRHRLDELPLLGRLLKGTIRSLQLLLQETQITISL